MGRIIILGKKDKVPEGFESHVRNNIVDIKDDLGGDERSAEFFEQVIAIGENTAIGRAMLAAIRDPEQPLDFPIAPILSTSYGTCFDPDVPGVVYNFATSGYFAAAAPQRVRASVMLFHELGHAVQWVQKRGWCQQQMKVRSKGGFNDAVERDNLVTHEWPLCKELGHPTRMHYTDMFDSAEEARKRFDVTTQAATVIQSAVRGFLVRQRMKK